MLRIIAVVTFLITLAPAALADIHPACQKSETSEIAELCYIIKQQQARIFIIHQIDEKTLNHVGQCKASGCKDSTAGEICQSLNFDWYQYYWSVDGRIESLACSLAIE